MKLPLPATRETFLSIVILMSTMVLSQQQGEFHFSFFFYFILSLLRIFHFFHIHFVLSLFPFSFPSPFFVLSSFYDICKVTCTVCILIILYALAPGRVAQSVGHLTRKSGVRGSIPGLATYFRFSFRFFKKGSCHLLAKVYARSTG